jgi:hypothetical protein
MKQKKVTAKNLLTGFLFYLLLISAFFFSYSLKLLPEDFIKKVNNILNQSGNSLFALILISFVVASCLWLIVWLIAMGSLKISVVNANSPIWLSILTIPVQIVLAIGLFAIVVLLIMKPLCESPAVIITIQVDDEIITVDSINPISVIPNSRLMATAKALNDDTLSCKWTSAGSGIQSIEPMNQCITSINLSNSPTNAIVTLTSSSILCQSQSTYPFKLVIKP